MLNSGCTLASTRVASYIITSVWYNAGTFVILWAASLTDIEKLLKPQWTTIQLHWCWFPHIVPVSPHLSFQETSPKSFTAQRIRHQARDSLQLPVATCKQHAVFYRCICSATHIPRSFLSFTARGHNVIWSALPKWSMPSVWTVRRGATRETTWQFAEPQGAIIIISVPLHTSVQ